MKNWIVGILLSVLSVVGIASSEAVMKIVGGQGACDTTNTGCIPIPLTVTMLCDGSGTVLNCPQLFAPDRTDSTGQTFYGINNGYAPRRCVKSVNGGSTWAQCSSHPFASISTGPVYFSVTSLGALVAAGRTATNFCEIKRSIDGGISWSLVFSSAVGAVACNNLASNVVGGSLLKCTTGNYCVLHAVSIFSAELITPIVSTDNGETWTAQSQLTTGMVDAPIRNMTINDSTGIAVGLMRATSRNIIGLGAWSVSAVWGTLPANEYCTGIIMSAIGVLCTPDPANDTVYTFRGSGGGLIASFTMLNAPIASGGTITGLGISSNVGYVIGIRVPGVTSYNIWVTTNAFGNTVVLKTITPATYFTGCCTGDMLYYNGKIYITSGGEGGAAQFISIS